MSVCDPENGMHAMFRDILPVHYFVSSPSSATSLPDKNREALSLREIENRLKLSNEEIAAVILEPLVQGAGGMKFYSFDFLKSVRWLCNKYDVLLIFDEIATGFGRTGNLFAFCNGEEQVEPDILTLGKALSAGYITSGATLVSEEICKGISENPYKNSGSFMHGPTFMGNPLTCSLCLASVNLLLTSPWQSRVQEIEVAFTERLPKLKEKYPQIVSNVRVKGAIGVIELNAPLYDYLSYQRVNGILIESGVWLRPFGKLLYSMPPFNAPMSAKEINQVCDAMEAILHTAFTERKVN